MSASSTPVAPSRLLVLAVVLLVIGGGLSWLVTDRAVDQARVDAAEDRAAAFGSYARCLEGWGTRLVADINTNRGKRARFDAADIARNEAFAETLRVLTRLRTHPPTATEVDVAAVLEEFRRADVRYRRAYATLGESRPYRAPDITCELSGPTKE